MVAEEDGAASTKAPIWANGEWAACTNGAPAFIRALGAVGSTSTGVPPFTWNASRCAAGSHFIRSVCWLPKKGADPMGTVLAEKFDRIVPVSGELLSQRNTWKRATWATQSR